MKRAPLSAALLAPLLALAALISTSAEASRTSGWSAAAAPQAPAALAHGAVTPAALSVERALALDDGALEENDAPSLVLFVGDELDNTPSARARSFRLDGAELPVARLATEAEPSYPETRVRGFDFLGQEVVGVERELSLTLHWGSGVFGLELASGSGKWLSEDPAGTVDSPSLYAFVGNRPNLATDPTGREAALSQSGWIVLTGVHTGKTRRISPAEITANGDDVRRALVLEGGLDPRAADQLMVQAGAGSWIAHERTSQFIKRTDVAIKQATHHAVKTYVATAAAATAGVGAAAVGAGAAVMGAVSGVAAVGASDVMEGKVSSPGTYLAAAAGGAVLGRLFQAGRIGEGPSTLSLPEPGRLPALPVREYSDGSFRTPDGKFASQRGAPAPGANKARRFANFLRSNGLDVVGEEMEVLGPLGVRRYDVVVRVNGKLHGIEVKSGTADKTPYQDFSDLWVNRMGALEGRGRLEGEAVESVTTVFVP